MGRVRCRLSAAPRVDTRGSDPAGARRPTPDHRVRPSRHTAATAAGLGSAGRSHPSLVQAILAHANLGNANLSAADHSYADLAISRLTGANPAGATATGVNVVA